MNRTEKQARMMMDIRQIHDEEGRLFYTGHCYCGWQFQTDTMKEAWGYWRGHLLIGGILGLFQQGNMRSHPIVEERQ